MGLADIVSPTNLVTIILLVLGFAFDSVYGAVSRSHI